MGRIVNFIVGALQKALGTSHAESLSATANIFVGQTEAPLAVKRYLPTMTPSELFVVMTAGLASVAGSVLASYAALGVELRYLLAANFMAAPAGLIMAKIIVPETDQPRERVDEAEATAAGAIQEDQPVNVIHAAAIGASSGLQLALNIGAMLIACIDKVAVNATLAAARTMLGVIRDTDRRCGFKAAGGIDTTAEAAEYLALANQVMGPRWVDAEHFRFGASSLLVDLLRALGRQTAGQSEEPY